MKYSELVNAVYVETARSDLVDETSNAVLSSTLKMHGLDFFYKDITSFKVVFDSAAYIQQLDIASCPRYRSLKYARKWDPTFNAYQLTPTALPPLQNNSLGVPINPNLALKFFEIIEPDDILDDFNTEKTDVAYQIGNSLNFKSSTSFSQMMFGYYQWPNVVADDNLFSSWIANEYPWAIIFDAASACLQKIGMQDAARKYDMPPDPRTGFTGGLVWSHIQNLRNSNITAVGR